LVTPLTEKTSSPSTATSSFNGFKTLWEEDIQVIEEEETADDDDEEDTPSRGNSLERGRKHLPSRPKPSRPSEVLFRACVAAGALAHGRRARRPAAVRPVTSSLCRASRARATTATN
jgi:hypothetical protein